MTSNIEQALASVDVLRRKARQELKQLKVNIEVSNRSFWLFNAGTREGKSWFGLFPRDLLTACLMLRDPVLLRDTIGFCVATIGRKRDPLTGEEQGRVLHEWNRVERDGYFSQYNAAETSHLFIIAAWEYLLLGEDIQAENWADALRQAGKYILRHIEAGLFWEDPRHCGATRYMAYATYWKDSHLPGRLNVAYPIAYTLVQAQTVAALRALAGLEEKLQLGFSVELLQRLASEIIDSLWETLWDQGADYPLLAMDNDAKVPGISSDALHMLAYLNKGDVPEKHLKSIVTGAQRLETRYGYRSYAPGQTDYAPDSYHLGSIWPYEQFFIAKGARTHSLAHVLECSVRVTNALLQRGFPELITWEGTTLGQGGCDLQLWSAAYPEAIHALLTEATL